MSTAEGLASSASVNDITQITTIRQYNLQQWWNAATQGQVAINLAVSTSLDIFNIQLTSQPTSCSAWHQACLTAFRAKGGTSSAYSSYIWIFPGGYNLAGCSNNDPNSGFVNAQLGSCSGACYNFITSGTVYIQQLVYAIGRNLGLKRSNALTAGGSINVGLDTSCLMGNVFLFDGIQRRGFNALRMLQLGLVQTQVSQNSGTLFLAALYEYKTAAANAVRLLQLQGTSYYLSYRNYEDDGVDRNNNWGAVYMQNGQNQISATVQVLRLEADGTSTLMWNIPKGTTYTVSGTSFRVQHVWNNNNGAMISYSNTGTLPTAAAQTTSAVPTSGYLLQQVSVLDTYTQSSSAGARAFAPLQQLVLNWNGDDRNSSCFIRLPVNVPPQSKITSATLVLEADQTQLASQFGTTTVVRMISQTANAPIISGNAFTTPYFMGSTMTLQGDWFIADDVNVDVTTQVQWFVNQATFQTGNYLIFLFYSADVNQQTLRTVQSGGTCGINGGGNTPCGPRLALNWTPGTSGPPPVNCAYTWSVWSVCAGGPCGGVGTQTSNLLITQQPQNGGTACPTTTTRSQSCTMAPCVLQPVNCQYSWGAWSTCSGPCSSFGTQTRSLIITQQPQNGGTPCPSTQIETNNNCVTSPCPPVNCVVQWGQPSACQGNCGQFGTQCQTYTVVQAAQYGGTACPSQPLCTSCQMPPCNQDCVVTYSGPWSACQGTCGGNAGTQTETGTITTQQQGAGASCPPLVRSRSCTTGSCPAVNCAYTWGAWSACMGGQCGQAGTQSRTPLISTTPSNGGTPCPSAQTETCVMPACGSVNLAVSETSVSAVVYGAPQGAQAVDGVYEVITQVGAAVIYQWNFQIQLAQSVLLNIVVGAQALQGQSLLVQWQTPGYPWTTVVTINSVLVQQYQVQVGPGPITSPTLFSIRVANSNQNTVPVSPIVVLVDYIALVGYPGITPPAVPCVQSAWVSSGCSSNCGTGQETLTRFVVVQPANGGTPCGASTMTQACSSYTACPVNCGFSAWSSWSTCSVACGPGTQTRTRYITTQPSNGGLSCDALGGTTQTETCQLAVCQAVDCVWGAWGAWSPCSAQCGTGSQSRSRTIQQQAQQGGKQCTGPSTETQACNTLACRNTPIRVWATTVTAVTSQGVSYQTFGAKAVPIPGAATSVLAVGAVTQSDPNVAAGGYWEVSTEVGSTYACSVTAISSNCPSPANTLLGGGIIGGVACSNSYGLQLTVNVTWTVVCL